MEYVLPQRNFAEVLNQWRDQINPHLATQDIRSLLRNGVVAVAIS
jgi:hypothetical protein